MWYLLAVAVGFILGVIFAAEAMFPAPLNTAQRMDREQHERNMRFARELDRQQMCAARASP